MVCRYPGLRAIQSKKLSAVLGSRGCVMSFETWEGVKEGAKFFKVGFLVQPGRDKIEKT